MFNFDENLTTVLELATQEELGVLVELIKKASLSEGLTSSDLYKKFQPDHTQYREVIGEEIRKFGGHTFLNLFRGEGPAYYDIVCDVANELKANYAKGAAIEDIELAISMRVVSTAWEKMSDDEKMSLLRAMGQEVTKIPTAFPLALLTPLVVYGGFKAYMLTVIVANAVAKALVGGGLSLATNAALTRGLAILTGPVGWTIATIWTALELAGPAYRVTIPCVIYIAGLRQKYSMLYCQECNSPYTKGSKFCQNCGAKLEELEDAEVNTGEELE